MLLVWDGTSCFGLTPKLLRSVRRSARCKRIHNGFLMYPEDCLELVRARRVTKSCIFQLLIPHLNIFMWRQYPEHFTSLAMLHLVLFNGQSKLWSQPRIWAQRNHEELTSKQAHTLGPREFHSSTSLNYLFFWNMWRCEAFKLGSCRIPWHFRFLPCISQWSCVSLTKT